MSKLSTDRETIQTHLDLVVNTFQSHTDMPESMITDIRWVHVNSTPQKGTWYVYDVLTENKLRFRCSIESTHLYAKISTDWASLLNEATSGEKDR